MFENEGQATEQPVESSPEVSSEVAPGTPQETAPPAIPDLDSMEKFRYGGRELTPKELQAMVMMQSDYTRKTQALAQERRFYDNLASDLQYVRGNPSLVDKFKSTYPEKFHHYLEYVLPIKQTQQSQPSQYYQLDPELAKEYQALRSDVAAMKAEASERAIAAINAELDAKFKTLSEKYPFADEEAAIARAQALRDRGEKLTDQVWDKIWKSVHESNQAKWKSFQANQIKQQKSVNAKGKDVAPGGGIPGQAPVKPKTIKEASKYALEAMENL